MIIKVCGMRDPENIRAVEVLGIDLMGFIFWPGSGRYVGEKPAYLPRNCHRAGVFVDAAHPDILAAVRDFGLHVVQLHGHEAPEAVAALKEKLDPDVCIVKSLAVMEAGDLAQTSAYEDLCSAFLFDTKGPLPGGNGCRFDWSVLEGYRGRLPFFLSGGIGPEDAERVKAFHVPGCMGIDLNSRFESTPGLKDVERLKTFIETIRS